VEYIVEDNQEQQGSGGARRPYTSQHERDEVAGNEGKLQARVELGSQSHTNETATELIELQTISLAVCHPVSFTFSLDC